jgi:hypothetical protein
VVDAWQQVDFFPVRIAVFILASFALAFTAVRLG